jgi:hypothetical protein
VETLFLTRLARAAAHTVRPAWRLALTATVFFGAIALLAAGARYARSLLPNADIPPHWPLSVFGRQLPIIDASPTVAAHGALVLAAGLLGLWLPVPRLRSVWPVAAGGLALLLATNTIQGYQYGLVNPVAGGNIQYYHDATRIESPERFIREFNSSQAHLGSHARVHPPAATLTFWCLSKVFGRPDAIAVALAAMAAFISCGFLYAALLRRFDRQTAATTTLMFMLLPAVQVYYCASLDALITSLSAVLLYFMLCERPFWGTLGTMLALAAMTSLTFTAVALLPVVAGLELLVRRRIWRLALVLLGVAQAHLMIGMATGYNWIESFRNASLLENPGGFTLLADPASYVFTRLENVAEIALFLGPFALGAIWQGMRVARREKRQRDLLAVSALTVLSLLGMFAAGAWRTGETARSTMFVLPMLMPVLACAVARMFNRHADGTRFSSLLLAQAVIMQTIGRYFW